MKAPVVSIHQPNFLPWLGFFDKIDRSDVFVLLDEVQLPRRTYTTRTAVSHRGRLLPLRVPIQHEGSQHLIIADAHIDRNNPLLRKAARTLQLNFSSSPFWEPLGPPIVALLSAPPQKLLPFNLALLRLLLGELGLQHACIRLQSELPCTGQKSELMATLTAACSGKTYLSGGWEPTEGTEQNSGASYNDESVFAAHGVALRYQNFRQPTYEQGCDKPIFGLSALDALFRLGGEKTMTLVRSMRRR
jgi:hypothetical protein